MASLHFELVSPERLLMSAEVAQVVIPGSEGEMTVLPGHAPVLSTLKPGVISVSLETSGAPERIFVRGGLAEINPKGLIVLAELAVPIAELDPGTLAQEVKNAEEDVVDAKDDGARRRAQETLDHLRALQQAL